MKKRITTLLLCARTLLLCAQWQSLNGPTGDGVTDFIESGSHLLVSTGNGVFRSDDQGQSWSLASQDLRGLHIGGLARWNGALFAFEDAQNDRLFRSDDEGTSWTEVPAAGMPNAGFHQITATDNALFLTFPAIARSFDGGLNWEPVTAPAPLRYYYTRLIARQNVLFLVAPGQGIYRSVDQGDTWELLTGKLPKAPESGFVHGNSLFTSFYSNGWKMYRSADLGQSWSPDVFAGLQLQPEHFAVIGPNVFTISGYTIWTSPLNGNSWSKLADASAAAFADDSNVAIPYRIKFYSAGARLFATAYTGIYFSENAGFQWTETQEGLQNGTVRDILITDDAVLCAASIDMYRYELAAPAWMPLGGGLPASPLVLNLSEVDDRIYAGANYWLWRSDDVGVSWQKLAAPFHDFYTHVVRSGSALLAGTSFGMQRSTDEGLTWSFSSEGMAIEDFDVTVYPFIRALTATGDTVLAADFYELYRSENGGLNWEKVDSVRGAIQFLANGDRIYRVTAGSVQYTDDSGYNWTTVTFSHSNPVSCIATISGFLFAGTRGGVLISKDKGNTWVFYGAGLPSNLWVNNLEIKGNYLYAGTASEGVWRFSLNTVLPAPVVPEKPVTVSVYPNPAHSTARLDLPLQTGERASLRIINANGRVVRTTTVSGPSAVISRDGLPGGLYFFEIRKAEEWRAAGRFVLE